MPNHVRNIIEFSTAVSEPEMKGLFEAILSPSLEDGRSDNGYFFDFNRLIEMPEALAIEESTATDMGMLLYHACHEAITLLPGSLAETILNTKKCGDVFTSTNMEGLIGEYKRYLLRFHPNFCRDARATEIIKKLNQLFDQAKMYMEMNTWEKVEKSQIGWIFILDRSWIMEKLRKKISDAGFDPGTSAGARSFSETPQGRELYELGKNAHDNLRLYGFKNWRDWKSEKWGTQWNSYENKIDQDYRKIRFSTVWNAPVPIATELSRRFPMVDFIWTYAEEKCGINTGHLKNIEGKFTIDTYRSCSDEAYEAYTKCWGDKCMYQNKKGAWRPYSCDTCPHPC